ncbi:hypothetical protein COD17_09875 [Bacillus thuringiensis]|nr:hypothetical protein COD17_09875 [Bacillus thuringiensis]
MATYEDVFQSLDLERLSPQYTEEFGRRLTRQILLHIGMVRYAGTVSVKTFDLSRRDIGTLTDGTARLTLGISRIGESSYKKEIATLLLYIGDMIPVQEEGMLGGSVRKDLRMNMLREMKDVRNRHRQQTGYWKIY